MGIWDFVKKLLPRFERSSIAEDLRATDKELEKLVIPAYDTASNAFRSIKLESDDVKMLQSVYNANIGNGRYAGGKNFIADIALRLKNLHNNVGFISEVLDKVVDKDIITAGLTTRSAFVLRSASNMSFISRYLMSLLNYVYTAEMLHRDVEPEPGIEISKAEKKHVEANFHTFVKLLARYSEEPKTFDQMFVSIAELHVSERQSQMHQEMLARKEADPLGDSGYAGFVGSPIYSVRLAFANWQNSRYEAAKSKKQQLELRLLYLENQLKDRKDPALVNEISRLQDRIEKLDYQLSETDKDLGL